jgi:hypothetical protein
MHRSLHFTPFAHCNRQRLTKSYVTGFVINDAQPEGAWQHLQVRLDLDFSCDRFVFNIRFQSPTQAFTTEGLLVLSPASSEI